VVVPLACLCQGPDLAQGASVAGGRSAIAASEVTNTTPLAQGSGCGWRISMRAMASSGLHEPAVELLGRERECAVIDRLVEDANAGVSGALVVRGEAGIGKTALLGYAAQRAGPAMLVLRAGGVEAESDLAFAGLHGLLRPVLAHLAELPETQSRALAGALGLAPSAHSDRLLVSAAVLSLLAAAAEDRPIVCVVDDAQWVDRPSADALVFTARRLQAERMAVLFGAREGEARRFEAAGVAELPLTGLSPPSAAAVLATRARNAAPAVQERLLAEAEGNPLALLELSAGLPRPLVVTGRGLAVGDLRLNNRAELLPAEAAPLSLARTNTGNSARNVRATRRRRRGARSNGLSVVDRAQHRAQRRQGRHLPGAQRLTKRPAQPGPDIAAGQIAWAARVHAANDTAGPNPRAAPRRAPTTVPGRTLNANAQLFRLLPLSARWHRHAVRQPAASPARRPSSGRWPCSADYLDLPQMKTAAVHGLLSLLAGLGQVAGDLRIDADVVQGASNDRHRDRARFGAVRRGPAVVMALAGRNGANDQPHDERCRSDAHCCLRRLRPLR
jgi:hypothetical protein